MVEKIRAFTYLIYTLLCGGMGIGLLLSSLSTVVRQRRPVRDHALAIAFALLLLEESVFCGLLVLYPNLVPAWVAHLNIAIVTVVAGLVTILIALDIRQREPTSYKFFTTFVSGVLTLLIGLFYLVG